MNNKKSNILIVDDEIMIIRSLIRALDDSAYNILHTVETNKALDILANTPIDVIISDQRMPEMTGLELMMKAKEIQPSSVRILMSAYSDIDIVIAAINEGRIYQYITKPWDNDKLVEIVAGAVVYKAEEDEKAAILAYRLENIESWKDIVNQLNNELEKKKSSTANALLKVLKAKDMHLYQHSYCVAKTSVLLAGILGLPEENKQWLHQAGLLHDIGKIAIRDKIMYKPSALDEDEFAEMQQHPTVGAEILRESDFPEIIIKIVEQHHEREDAVGYPKGIDSDQILLEAKIIAVADSFEALCENRVYKKGMSPAAALEIICEDREKFNSTVLNALKNAVAAGLTCCGNPD